MKQVQVNFEVSPEALERARKAFAKVTLTKEQTQQIEQASEAVAHVAVLAGVSIPSDKHNLYRTIND